MWNFFWLYSLEQNAVTHTVMKLFTVISALAYDVLPQLIVAILFSKFTFQHHHITVLSKVNKIYHVKYPFVH